MTQLVLGQFTDEVLVEIVMFMYEQKKNLYQISEAQAQDLLKRTRQGDQIARDELIRSQLWLIGYVSCELQMLIKDVSRQTHEQAVLTCLQRLRDIIDHDSLLQDNIRVGVQWHMYQRMRAGLMGK